MNAASTPSSDSRPSLPSPEGEAAHASPARSARLPMGARVLVIDDEPEIWRAVRAGLVSAGFTAEWASTAAEGVALAVRWHPDVLILDLSLPDQDGLDVCRQVRTWSQVPIIVLSVRGKDEDKVTALELGADDYLTKPFSLAELIARIRVALRHAARPSNSGGDQARFQTGALVLDFERRQVTMNGREVHLTPTEYDLLKYLAINAGKVLTHRAILRAIWGPAYEQETSYLRVFFNQLRRKIEPDPSRPRYLLTELGIGYRLRELE